VTEPDSLPHSSTPELLTALETCPRKGWYSQRWQAQRMISSRMVSEAIQIALSAPVEAGRPLGEVAGDAMMQLAEDRGMDIDTKETRVSSVYDAVLNHACLADLLVTAIRKPTDPPWLTPPASNIWTSGCFLAPDGNSLRRVVLVSHWSDERKFSESRNWYTAGEIAHYDLPMQLVVLIIGQMRNGRRRGPWTQGFCHPQNHQLRFRRRRAGNRSEGEHFNERWEQIWREDHAEISRETWLESMLKDDVLPEVCFRIDIPTLSPPHRQRILEIRERKLDALHAMKEKPDVQLSGCHWPMPCEFLRCCHSDPEREPSAKNGFVRLVPREASVD
jgi:hypothetical protein